MPPSQKNVRSFSSLYSLKKIGTPPAPILTTSDGCGTIVGLAYLFPRPLKQSPDHRRCVELGLRRLHHWETLRIGTFAYAHAASHRLLAQKPANGRAQTRCLPTPLCVRSNCVRRSNAA
jgi:hypothetical protein